jgi:hypothetical protein
MIVIANLIVAGLAGLGCCLWARHEDRSGFGWFLFGFLLAIVAIPILLVLTIQDRRRRARVAAEDRAVAAESWL